MIFEKTITKMYEGHMLRRYDPDGTVFYFSPEDFEGLLYERFEFTGFGDNQHAGYFYKKEVSHPERLVVFEHGIGCGHRAYMKEIVTLCDAGYEVFAYDHTGTLSSGGEHIGGFSQSLADLDFAISALKASGRLGNRKIAVIGHSWGGFSTMNIGAFHPEIDRLVALAGFVSVEMMLRSVLGILGCYAPAIHKKEVEKLGAYALADARVSLFETQARALVIHSTDDPTVPFSHHEALREILEGRENITLLAIEGKRHNPNYTREAVVYKDDFFAKLTQQLKKKKLITDADKAAFVAKFDWHKMTEQDPDVWGKIIEFIK